ncbi:MAG: zf-HC2 domain-containing protein [Gemmatimonadota bacterium]|nr:zf-HC2 domain-containing protein [Gemmatimonadota bacterium]
MTKPIENDPWVARLSEYVDGEMSGAEAQELEAHLPICETCPVVLRDLTAVVQTLRQNAMTASVSADADRIWPRVISRLSTDRIVAAEGGAYERSWLVDSIIAALILAVGIITGYWLGQCGRTNGWPKPAWLHLGTASAPAVAQPVPLRAPHPAVLVAWRE